MYLLNRIGGLKSTMVLLLLTTLAEPSYGFFRRFVRYLASRGKSRMPRSMFGCSG